MIQILLFAGLLAWVVSTLTPGSASQVLRIAAAVAFGVGLAVMLVPGA